MSFLKKFGQAALKVTQIVLGIAPMAEALLPAQAAVIGRVESELTQVAGVITSIEAVGAALSPTLTGAQKLQAAGPLVGQVVAQSALMVGKKIANETLYAQAVTEITQGVVDLLNSLHADAVQTTSLT